MIKLPLQLWKQDNRSDKLGNISSSYNLDLTSKYGELRVSPRMLLNSSSADDSDIGVPCAVKQFTTTDTTPRLWWMMAGANLFYSTGGLAGTLTKFSSAPHPSGNIDPDYSDMEVFNNVLVFLSTTTAAQRLARDGTTTAMNNTVLTGAGFHGATYFRAQNRLYYVDDSSRGISSMNTSYTIVLANSGSQYSLNLLVDGVSTYITWIRATSTRIWIGTINFNGDGYVYAWDGSQTTGPNEAYKLETAGSFACVIKNDAPWIIDVQGRLLAFNGGTFEEKDRLPLDPTSGKLLPNIYKGTQRLVHYNGMTLDNGRINILVNTAPYTTSWPASTSLERMPSGIWEYDENIGLYHKKSLGTTKSGGTITDYGQQKLKYVGCLASLKFSSLDFAVNLNGSLLAGAEYYSDTSTSLKGVFYDDYQNTLQKAGYIETSKIFSPNVSDTWQKIYARFRKFLSATDKIVIKARTAEDEPTEATITFTSTTAFTVPTASFSTAPAVGDEVEILQGAIGAGRTAHITAVTTSAPNYAITVDETITGATTQTAKARFQTWKKIGSYSAQTDEMIKFPLYQLGRSAWVQLKIWFLWTGKNELHDLIISNTVGEKIE